MVGVRRQRKFGRLHHGPSRERQIQSGAVVRQALWEADMKNQTAALEETLTRTEGGAGRAQSSAAGGRET